MVSGVSWARDEVAMCPACEKTRSTPAEEAGIARIPNATLAKNG